MRDKCEQNCDEERIIPGGEGSVEEQGVWWGGGGAWNQVKSREEVKGGEFRLG